MPQEESQVVIIVSEESAPGVKTVASKERNFDNYVKPPNTNDIFNNQHNEVSCHPQETRALGKCNSFPLPKRNLLQVPLSTLDSPWYGSETSLESDTSFESGSSGSKLYDHNAAIRRDILASSFHQMDGQRDKNGIHRTMQNSQLQRTLSAPFKDLKSRTENVKSASIWSKYRLPSVMPTRLKKSLSVLSDDKSSISRSRFSLRRTLSATFWSSSANKENEPEIAFPNKNKKKPVQKFRIVEGKTRQTDGISFEVIGKQGIYLRVKGTSLVTDRDTQDSYFNKDCTFIPLPGMWFDEFFSFESVSKPSFYIRLRDEELVIDKFDGTADFKMEASFKLSRRPCATCLQVGVKTWAKVPSGEYCIARIIALNNLEVAVEFEDGKTESYLLSDTGKFIPDIIPCKEDISVGTRVLAQWLDRDTLYPGVISNVRGGDNYDVLFDDGDKAKERSDQIRLMRTYSFPSSMHQYSPAKSIGSKSESQLHSSIVQPHNINSPSGKNGKPLSQDAKIQSNGTTRKMSNTNVVLAPWEIETFSQDSGYHDNEKGQQNCSVHGKHSIPSMTNTHCYNASMTRQLNLATTGSVSTSSSSDEESENPKSPKAKDEL